MISLNIEKIDYDIRYSSCFGELPKTGTIIVHSNRVELIENIFKSLNLNWNVITNTN